MRPNSETEGDELVLEITRVFDAPPDLVFRMWQDPEHLVRWHGPESLWLISCTQDFRIGGSWRRCMSSRPGHAHWISGVFTEIAGPSRLCFTYINEYDGFEMLVEMDFVPLGDKTQMHFRQGLFKNIAERDGHGRGWNSSLGLLADYIKLVEMGRGKPVGQPRIDGVALDIAAARARAQQAQQQQ